MNEKLTELQRRMQEFDREECLELFLEWILGQGIEGKLTFFHKWTEAETDPVFLKKVKVAWGFTRPDTSGMEAHFDAVFTKNYDQPSDRVALVYMSQIKAPSKMRGLFIKAAVRTKRRVYKRMYQRKARGSEKTGGPMSSLTARAVPAGREVGGAARHGRVFVPPHGKGLWDQVPEYKVQLGRRAGPEDFERILAPYREHLRSGGVGELAEGLLQLLDAHGDCPSVIGKSYDIEYQKLKKYPDKRLLGALGKVSLYDHTLHVLEHALSAVANDERGHLQWFIPAIVVAALGHDVGKIPAMRERRRMADHASTAVMVLKKMMPAGINPEINKYIVPPSTSTIRTSWPRRRLR